MSSSSATNLSHFDSGMISSVRWTVPSSAIGTTVYGLSASELFTYCPICPQYTPDPDSYVFCGSGSTSLPLSLAIVADYASSSKPTGSRLCALVPVASFLCMRLTLLDFFPRTFYLCQQCAIPMYLCYVFFESIMCRCGGICVVQSGTVPQRPRGAQCGQQHCGEAASWPAVQHLYVQRTFTKVCRLEGQKHSQR